MSNTLPACRASPVTPNALAVRLGCWLLTRPSVAELFCFLEIGLRPRLFALFTITDYAVVVGFGKIGIRIDPFTTVLAPTVVAVRHATGRTALLRPKFLSVKPRCEPA